MTYRRVIPRDLFNEANLLKCLGQLWLKLEDRVPESTARMTHTGGPFHIRQRPADGSTHVENVRLIVRGRLYDHSRPLNSREPWPLYVWDAFYEDPPEVPVFTDEGDLTPEFEALVGIEGAPPEDDDSYPPPCTNPGGHAWLDVEESERCLCVHCGADGDA